MFSSVHPTAGHTFLNTDHSWSCFPQYSPQLVLTPTKYSAMQTNADSLHYPIWGSICHSNFQRQIVSGSKYFKHLSHFIGDIQHIELWSPVICLLKFYSCSVEDPGAFHALDLCVGFISLQNLTRSRRL